MELDTFRYESDTVYMSFNDFEPSLEERDFVARTCDKIHDRAPSGSNLFFTIFKSDTGVEATCRIASFAGSFEAVASGENLSEVIQAMSDEMGEQLMKWKRFRFLGEAA